MAIPTDVGVRAERRGRTMQGMDTPKLQVRSDPAFRTFRICLDRPEPRLTILGIVRRVAAEQAASGQPVRRSGFTRRAGIFA